MGWQKFSLNLPPSAFPQVLSNFPGRWGNLRWCKIEAEEPSALRYPGSSTCLVAAEMCLISVYMALSGSGVGRALCIFPLFLTSVFLYVKSILISQELGIWEYKNQIKLTGSSKAMSTGVYLLI